MAGVLKGIKDQWIPRAEIREMAVFLLANPQYLYPLNNVVTQTCCLSHLQAKLDLAIEEAVSLHMIKRGGATNQFATISARFVECDLARSGAARGDLLEYLCYSRGPFVGAQSREDEILRFRKCTLQNAQGETLCGENNFDVGFFHACAVILELQECKYRLANYLDGSRATNKKLDYMKCIQQRLSRDSFATPVVFVTMQHEFRREENALKEMGYDFTIYGFGDVLSLIA